MKMIKVEKAVGMVLAHDITRIVPGEFKGVAFKKGHVVREEDIAELLKLGKQHLFALNFSRNHLHEDEAALRISKAICGKNLRWTEPREGKSNIISQTKGLLKIHAASLSKINKIGNIIVSTLNTNSSANTNQTVAATRIIPLTLSINKIKRLENIAEKGHPVIEVLPYRKLKFGAVVTGSEIYEGLIADGFDQYVGRKVCNYGSEVIKKILVPDDPGRIAEAIGELRDIGCEAILTTGGLSVDPDDLTRKGVKRTGAQILIYGAPVLPGAMFLYALLDNIPILGLPACVYYHNSTIFDLTLPRVLAGDKITKNEIAEMGHGGLCMNCEQCRFPVCPFGK